MYDVIKTIFTETLKINLQDNTKIQFKLIFDCLESVEYYNIIPKVYLIFFIVQFLNNRMTKDNNKIIIACLCILSKNLYNVKYDKNI